jgi:hypothetical protein
MATKRFKDLVGEGQVLFDNLAPHLTDIPQLAADHAALGNALAQARDLEGRQETAKGQLRELNDQRGQVAQQTADLRRKLIASLKGSLGTDNLKLLEFGVKPRPQTFKRPRLTPAQKAARAAERAVAKAATLAAAEETQNLAPPSTHPPVAPATKPATS